MYLEKLEIQGFKSFAQKTVLSFLVINKHTKGVTAVVGPNGSGKSNIADAIRWALGEQSTKQLRGKKSEDIIFFGSQIKSRLGYAEVSLYFNNEDSVFPFDYPEVVITRRLYRDDQSLYLLNNNITKLSDIILLLAQAHVGQKSYSVIGQGMIDTIINATPADRKDFFYEAAGVKVYQIKKDQSISKLHQTETNVSQITLQLAELEPKLKYLKRQMGRLAQREQWEKEYGDVAKQLYNHQWNIQQDRIGVLHKQEEQIKKQITDIKEKLSALQHTFDSFENLNIDTQQQSNKDSLTKKINDLYRQQRELLSHISLISGRLELDLEKKGKAHLSWITRRIDEVTLLQQDLSHQKEEVLASQQYFKKNIDTLTKNKERLLQQKKEEEGINQPPSHTQSVLIQTKKAIQEILSTKDVFYKETETLERLVVFTKNLYSKIDTIFGWFSVLPTNNTTRETQVDFKRDVDREYAVVLSSLEKESVQYQMVGARLENLESQEEITRRELEKLQSELIYYGSDDKKERDHTLNLEKEKDQNMLLSVNKEILEIEQKLVSIREMEQVARSEVFTLQKEIQATQEQLHEKEQLFSQNQIECAKYSAHRDDLLEKLCEDLFVETGVRIELQANTESVVSVLGFDTTFYLDDEESVSRSMYLLKNKLAQLGMIDTQEVADYEETKNTVEFLQHQLEDLSNAQKSLEIAIWELDEMIKKQFTESMKHINKSFNEYFQEVFRGGSAKLILHKEQPVESVEDDTNTTIETFDGIQGVEIEATPPGKKIKSISFLSGGEKALASIALICAIMANNPSPFVVLDEVDAALDESNAHRFAYILTQLSHKTQFVVITHNRVTMHIAQRLYGVTMGSDGTSSVVSLDIDGVSDILTKQ
ncbi:MAG: AAA family ATPase [bacterium]|nr:AAA family ATPase [bacterium]